MSARRTRTKDLLARPVAGVLPDPQVPPGLLFPGSLCSVSRWSGPDPTSLLLPQPLRRVGPLRDLCVSSTLWGTVLTKSLGVGLFPPRADTRLLAFPKPPSLFFPPSRLDLYLFRSLGRPQETPEFRLCSSGFHSSVTVREQRGPCGENPEVWVVLCF